MLNMISYVTYDADTGALTGGFMQVPPEEHARRIEVPAGVRINWPMYRANAGRDGVEPVETVSVDLEAIRAAKNEAINAWRAAANLSTFPHAGKQVACDALSRSDIDGVANNIALFGAFPDGFPGGWKATDNEMIPMASIEDFRAMYASMTAQGAENFNRAQELKAQLAAASTPEEIAAIQW